MVRYQKYLNFQAKGLLPDRTLESFIPKSTEGAIPIFLGKFQTKRTLINKSFPDFLGRIFQVKGQSKKITILLSYSVLFCFWLKYFRKT